jgi:hypothetical protein
MLRLFDGFEHTSEELRDEVKALQRQLKKHGFKLKIDGMFGRETELCVKSFQAQQGLDDDGIAGPLTWAKLLGKPLPDLEATFPTTFPRNHPDLLRQLAEAEKYQTEIEAATGDLGFPACLIGGIGCRESAWGLALKPRGPGGTGDFFKRRFPTAHRTAALPPDKQGFGRGLMQIDFDAHEFARTGEWQDPAQNIRYGCQVLADNRQFFQRKSDLKGRELLRAALSAYNCGPGNTLKALRDGRDLDFYTTGRDYSKDVLNRTGFFQLHGWP